ncbi:MAG: 4Fe-4S ferredoxin, partial [Candidatus Delongbacteria bacterium]|nr:4Fe-4S ferredoxin [Candidatus Delongbacteria bacterium]
MIKELRAQAKKLLEDKTVDIIIGWGKGSLPLSATPIFITDPKDADQLIFDNTCRNNLTVYLTKD